MKLVPNDALRMDLAFATHVFDDDHNKVRAGKVHRLRSGRPMTATRNRQPSTWAACGARIVLAWPVLDFHLEVWGSSDVCLKCWPRWEQLRQDQKSDVDLSYGGDLRQTGHVRDLPWRRPHLSAVQRERGATSICSHVYPDGSRCRLVDHSAPGLADVHGVSLQDEIEHAILEETQEVPVDAYDSSPGGEIRKALLEALIDEYGFDSEHWVEMGSLERIARAVEAVTIRAEVKEELDSLTTCRLWVRGRMVFDGIDRSSLISYRGKEVRNEWGVRYPNGAVEAMADEESARRTSFKLDSLRPDLPTQVMRKVVTDWEVVPDGGH